MRKVFGSGLVELVYVWGEARWESRSFKRVVWDGEIGSFGMEMALKRVDWRLWAMRLVNMVQLFRISFDLAERANIGIYASSNRPS